MQTSRNASLERQREGHPDAALLRSFSPLESLDEANLVSLASRAQRRSVPFGAVLHREGDANAETFYLLKGQVELTRANASLGIVRAATEEARHPLSGGRRYKSTVTVTSPVAEVLVIATDVLDLLVTWDQTGSYRVTDLSVRGSVAFSEDDWMIQALQSPLLRRLPAVNLQALFMRMEKLELAAGDAVIRQGDDADFYYLLVKGRCAVKREVPSGGAPIVLAEVAPGGGFGEDALLSGARGNATVQMLTDGAVMRVSRADFTRLCSGPIVQEVSFAEADRLIAKGGYWLDVRLPSEIGVIGIRAAIEVPLYLLRRRMEHLPRGGTAVVFCDTGRRSAAAAFILASQGFDAVVLKDGLQAVPSQIVSADPRFVTSWLPGLESNQRPTD